MHGDGHIDLHNLEVGDPLPPLTKPPITKTQLVRYAGASGDFNPIHTDDETARKAGLRGVIAQGLLVMGFAGQAITQWVPKKYLKRFKVRFTDVTYPGDVITVKAILLRKIRENNEIQILCEVKAENQKEQLKLVGEFEASLPA